MEITLLFLLAPRSTARAVHLGSDGIGNVGQLLLLFLKVLSGSVRPILVKPLGGLLDGIQNLKDMVSELLKKQVPKKVQKESGGT